MEEPMPRLTRDLLAEILSRMPYKSLCICKCVCPAWCGIITDPVYRKKIARSLVGFFYQYHVWEESTADSAEPCGFSVRGVSCADLSAFPWASVPRTCPRLPLPSGRMDRFLSLRDSCDGLFLDRIWTGTPEQPRTRYVVSNAASTVEFHVLEFVREWPHHSWAAPRVVSAVQIYSSNTSAWVSMESKWDIEVAFCLGLPAVYHKGYLHVLMKQFGLAVVDIQGVTWRTIPVPKFIDPSFSGFIGKSAGQLLYINSDDCLVYGANLCSTISVYVLAAEVYHSHVDDEYALEIVAEAFKCISEEDVSVRV